MVHELQLGELPHLPRRATIEEISEQIWQRSEVAALWIGGSPAAGSGDLFSDVDFRIPPNRKPPRYRAGRNFWRSIKHPPAPA